MFSPFLTFLLSAIIYFPSLSIFSSILPFLSFSPSFFALLYHFFFSFSLFQFFFSIFVLLSLFSVLFFCFTFLFCCFLNILFIFCIFHSFSLHFFLQIQDLHTTKAPMVLHLPNSLGYPIKEICVDRVVIS